MSNWTHSICVTCWDNQNPGQNAVRTVVRAMKRCCFCGILHASGIFVRHDPKEIDCKCDDILPTPTPEQ